MVNEEVVGPLVTIVTPSLNYGHFIADAIESVLAQDYPRIEYIVMDGDSRDDTRQVVGRYGDRLTFVSRPDNGQSQALNRAFAIASGEIFGWLNADDRLLPGAIRSVVDLFQADRDAMLVYGDGALIDAAGLPLGPFRFLEPFNLRRLVEVSDFMLQPATFFRREAFEAVGRLDEGLNWCMDWDLWIRIGRRFPVRDLPVPLAEVRDHPATKTNLGGPPRVGEMHRVVRRYSRRWLPPCIVTSGGSVLYRLGCRAIGLDPAAVRPLTTVPPLARLLDQILATGRLPWEWRADPELRRAAWPPSHGRRSPALPFPDRA